jgi:hypothetical protein
VRTNNKATAAFSLRKVAPSMVQSIQEEIMLRDRLKLEVDEDVINPNGTTMTIVDAKKINSVDQTSNDSSCCCDNSDSNDEEYIPWRR